MVRVQETMDMKDLINFILVNVHIPWDDVRKESIFPLNYSSPTSLISLKFINSAFGEK